MESVMNKPIGLLLGLLLCGCAAAPTIHPVRQQFVPTDARASAGGASWSRLRAFPNHPGVLWTQARAGIGDSFPVQEVDGQTAFEVVVAEGDDEHLVVEVRS